MKKVNLILGLLIIVAAATVVVAAGVAINAVKALQLPALRWMFIVLFKLIRIADKLTQRYGCVKIMRHTLHLNI